MPCMMGWGALRQDRLGEKIDVEQRGDMDAVVTGLIGGSTVAILVVVGGAVAVWSDLYKKFSGESTVFVWLSFLSALTLGQLYLTYTLVSAFAAAPSQTAKATVA